MKTGKRLEHQVYRALSDAGSASPTTPTRSGQPIVLFWLALVLCLAGCRAREPEQMAALESEPPVQIGYGAPALDGAQVAIMQGLIDRAETQGWQVLVANANRDARVQAGQIDYFLAHQVDAVVVVPEDSDGICSSVQKAEAQGVLFYTIDRAPLGCEIEMTVLADNYMAGVQAGEALVALLEARYGRPQGTVLELQGDLEQNVAQLRGAGFHAAIDPYPDIEVLSRPTEWLAHRFAEATDEVLAAQQIDGIFMHSDCVGLPAVLPVLDRHQLKVPRQAENHIFLVGVDACPETLQAIRDGFVDQTSSQPFPDYGLIVEWMAKGLRGETIEAGQVVDEQALWSPAVVERGAQGWQLLLATTSVTIENVDDPRLWGNQ